MRIAVIGTSNAVLRGGYFYGMSDHPAVTRIDNFSIGASTSVALPMWMKNHDFRDYDFVLLDFALNEEAWVKLGFSSIATVEGCLMAFIASLGLEGPRPVMAILPSLSVRADEMPVRDLYRRIASDYGYPLFDGYNYLDREGLTYAIGADAAFLDVDHMQREIGHAFGTEIASALAEIAGQEVIRMARQVDVGNFRYIDLAECDIRDGTPVDRGTSLIKARAVRLTGDATVDIHLAEDVDLVGIGTNISQSNGQLRISCAAGRAHQSGNIKNFSGEEDRLTYSIVPMMPLRGRDFTIALVPGQNPAMVAEVIGLTALEGWSTAVVPACY